MDASQQNQTEQDKAKNLYKRVTQIVLFLALQLLMCSEDDENPATKQKGTIKFGVFRKESNQEKGKLKLKFDNFNWSLHRHKKYFHATKITLFIILVQ